MSDIDEIDPDEFEKDSQERVRGRRKSLRDRANEPSDTVGVGSSAAVGCSLIMFLVTVLLIAGLLISRAF
jgi:hypothetical protein